MYADYTYYAESFYGNRITADIFPKYAMAASDFIDYYTMGRAVSKADLPAVKKCCCALAEQYQLIENTSRAANAKVTDEGIIASESVGAHSRSFRNGVDGAQAVSVLQAELANIARRYLLPTGLLYRGGVSVVHSACGDAL